MKLRNSMLAVGMLLATSGWAHADPINGTLYYTTFSGGQNVWKVDFAYDGLANQVTSFVLTNDTNVASVSGADGIVFDPNTGNLLIGGQGTNVHMVTTGGVLVNSVSAGTNVSAFHLSVDPSGDTVWAGTCCGGDVNLGEVPLTPFATGTGHDVTGGVTFVDTLAWVPTGDINNPYTTWYTSSDSNGGECIGTINMATFVTTNVQCNLPASHGMVFDPLSQTLILQGDGHISQWDPFANLLVGDLDFSQFGVTFDQGTIDGKGHIFGATNNGYLFFVDYSGLAGNLLGTFTDLNPDPFWTAQFLRNSLDDVAPLVGPGAPVPEPMTLSLMGLGLAAAGRRAWNRRTARG